MKYIINILLLLTSSPLLAAGAVVGEAGSCMIEIGIYTAHFTIYQSDTRDNEEFCEDLPDTGNTLFVLDYLHVGLKSVPVDFRIIRDVDGLGIFARWENIQAITDLEARTVFYQSPTVEQDNQLTIEHNFLEPGGYIGVISAPHPSKDKQYYAVFPFQVGRIPLWRWLLLVSCVLVLGVYYWRRRSRAEP
jgi:hypothetical protein